MKNPLRAFGVSDRVFMAAIAGDAAVHKALEAKADEVAEAWKVKAPVFDAEKDRRSDPPYGGEPGEYRDSIKAGKVHFDKEGDLEILVESDDYKAIWIEFGAAHMPVYAPATETMREFDAPDGPIVTNSSNRPEVDAQYRANRRAKGGGRYGGQRKGR